MSKKKRGAKTQMNHTKQEQPDDAAPVSQEEPATAPVPAADEAETVHEEVAATDSPDVVEETPPLPDEASDSASATDNVIDDTFIDPAYRSDLQLLNERFERYCTVMAKGRPVGETEGAQQQVALWRIIDGVLRTDGQLFSILFTQLLALFNRERQRHGVLDERMRYRYFGAISLGEEEARNFESMLSAFITLSDPQSRALKLKMVDLPLVLGRYPDKLAVARIVDYFGV